MIKLVRTLNSGALVKFVFTVCATLLASCSFEEYKTGTSTTPPDTTIAFSADVQAIINAKGCTECHDPTASAANSVPLTQFLFDTPALLTTTDSSFGSPYVIPGDASNSVFYQKLTTSLPGGGRMPQGGPYLDATQLQAVADWINGLPATAL